jgi:hypothetical protein
MPEFIARKNGFLLIQSLNFSFSIISYFSLNLASTTPAINANPNNIPTILIPVSFSLLFLSAPN